MSDISILYDALLNSWDMWTAYDPYTWDNATPSTGQCAVTALVVQDYIGGELLRCPTIKGSSHYWNISPDGTEYDLTYSQFEYADADRPIKKEFTTKPREYLISNPDTLKRYERLKGKVNEFLAAIEQS